MPVSFTIIPAHRLKYVRITGQITYAELERTFYRFIRDPDFQPDLRMLVDTRDMTDAVGGLWEFWKLKRLYQYAYADAEAAIDVVIVTNTKLAHRAARVFAFLMRDKKPMRVHLTKDISTALAILDLPPESLPSQWQQSATSNVTPFARPR